MSDAAMVAVPREELLEAIAHVGALQTVLERLEGGFESSLAMRYSDVRTGLTGRVFEQPDGDLEYEQHPLNVRLESRSAELAGEFLIQLADAPVIYADELATCGARLLGDAREIRDRGTIGTWRAA